jgi:eukaryotic-like serine/threonine-protein kinase
MEYAINASRGTLLWSYLTGSFSDFSSSAVANGIVYVGGSDNLYALNATTGTLVWSNGPIRIASSPAVANGVVYVGSVDHNLNTFNASTGESLPWTYNTNDEILSSPVVVNGVIYIGSLDYKLYAFHLPGTTP